MAAEHDAMPGPGSLEDSLRLMRARLPGWLASDEQFSEMRALAARLPPAHHAGFEHRLGSTEPGLDLQQAIRLTAQRARHFPPGPAPGPRDPRRLLQVLFGLWRQHAVVGESFTQAWLEFDREHMAGGRASLFLTTRPGTRADRLEAALGVLTRGLHEAGVAPAPPHDFEGVLSAAAAAGSITHIGLMVSRADPGVRVIRPFDPRSDAFHQDDDPAFQRGMKALVAQLGEAMDDFSDLRRCDDLGSASSGRVSLECFFPLAHDDPGITRVLDRLRALGLCTGREHAFFRDWPGWLTPGDPALRWPDSLIVESLARPVDEFSAIECRLGHVKFSVAPGDDPASGLSAKLYFGYVSRWMRKSDRETEPRP